MLYTISDAIFKGDATPENLTPPFSLPCLASFLSVSIPRISTLAPVSRVDVSQDIGKRPRYQARDTAAKI